MYIPLNKNIMKEITKPYKNTTEKEFQNNNLRLCVNCDEVLDFNEFEMCERCEILS